jgi:heat-inducible transcriptional repressor
MLSPRQEAILKIIVGEYVGTATPIASESIAHNCGLRSSPATIRNEMARLEEEGYITRPHTSAGGVPSDKGYRYYVETLVEARELPPAEQLMIYDLFHQVERALEKWAHLAAMLLSRLVGNAALITPPKATDSRFRHLELVALQEFLALLVLVLREARIKQQLLPFEEAVSQDELSTIVNRLNQAYHGLTASQIWAKGAELYSLEEQVTKAVLAVMQAEDEQEYEQPYLDGLRHMLSQPEFVRSDKLLDMLEVFEDKGLLRAVLPRMPASEAVQVIIGGENKEEAMHQCSVVISGYGVPGKVSGAIGVVGPTRMHYARTISTVRYMSSMMSSLTRELYSMEGGNEDCGS